MIVQWIHKALGRPRTTLVVTVLVVLAMATQLLKLTQDTSAEGFLPRGHKSYTDKQLIDDLYGINDSVIIGITDRESASIYNPDALGVVKELTHFVQGVDGVLSVSVRSLASRDFVEGTEDGFNIVNFLDGVSGDAAGMAELRRRVDSFAPYRGVLVAEDAEAAFIVADVRKDGDMVAIFHEVQEQIAIVESEHNNRFQLTFAGPPVVSGTLNVFLNRDAMILDPIAGLITSLLLFFIFRSIAGIFLPFVVILPAIIFSFGSMGAVGAPFTPFSNAIPVVILAIGLADSIHVMGAYYRLRAREPELEIMAVVRRTMAGLWRPIIITSLTTAAGFWTLRLTSPVAPVQAFGMAVAIGGLIAMVASLFALPAVLLLLQPAVPPVLAARLAGNQPGRKDALSRAIDWVRTLVVYKPIRGMAALVLLLAAVGTGVLQLKVNYNPVAFFPAESSVTRDHAAISERFAGTNFVDIHIDSGAGDGVFNPELLKKVDGLQQAMAERAAVGKTISAVDFIKKMNQAVHSGDPDQFRIAATADQNSQLLFLFDASGDPTQLQEYIASGNRSLRIRVFLQGGDYRANQPFIDWLIKTVSTEWTDYKVVLGGEAYVNHHWMKLIESNVIESIALMLLGMLVVGWLLTGGSIGTSLLLVLPVTAGVFATYGVMGLMGVAIGLGTSIFASIAIGIGVDYAIHYLAHYREAHRKHGCYQRATFDTLDHTGRSLMGNAMTVVGGFLVLVFAQTVPPAQIGIYVAIGVSVSLATTFFILGVCTRFLRYGK